MRSHHVSIAHIICPTITTAPKDSAFDKLDSETIEYLTDPANVEVLSSILRYHAVSGNITSSDLVDFGNPSETDVPTLNGDGILVSVGYGGEYGILINGNASVIDPFDVIACNGVIHSLDTVLEPDPPTTPKPTPMPSSKPTPMPTPVHRAKSSKSKGKSSKAKTPKRQHRNIFE